MKLRRIVRVDLDGMAKKKCCSARRTMGSTTKRFRPVPGGDYSFVILRRVIAGKVQTQLVARRVLPEGDHLQRTELLRGRSGLRSGGDGMLEVVVHSGYYEDGETTIYG